MNQEHHKKDIRTNNVGATHDIDKELSGAENQGKYFDSENGRVSSDRGNKASWEKIRGEELVHDNSVTGTWFNLVSAKINDHIFEIWVETTNSDSPKIVIDGTIMGESVDFPWLYEHRIQFDVNENCIGGEIFLTDFNVPPVILNVQDIIDNFNNNTQKYFADFNPDLYYINLQTPLDIPVFRGLVDLGGGGGLPVGSYQYSLRYTTEAGDKTNWGVLTPPIPVLQSVDDTTTYNEYDGIKSYGDNPNLLNVTSFGVKLKFRITNLNNYEYVEIRRISYNTGGGVDVVPQGEIIAKIEISAGEISVYEFIDPSNANIDEETLADNEESYELSNIEKAKAIRYHDKRLILMNYETSSKETSLTIGDINGEKIIPVSRDLGSKGFNNPVNHVYYKNYQSGEKYSFGINCFDGSGGSGFVFEDDDLKNIQAPNRRDEVSTDSANLSYGDIPVAANVDSVVTNVFEIFDHENAVGKFVETKKNISTSGSKNGTDASDVGYEPFRPVDKNDVKIDHDYRINNYVRDSANNDTAYDPKAFKLDYYSRGFAIGPVTNLPSWVKSFSVVRSDRAKRVVCQGIGMYSMYEQEITPGNFAAVKDQDKFWFHSPDIASGLVSQSVIDDIQANPQNYKIQLVSPLGFFSEVYNFNNRTLTPDLDRIIDMIAYPRILHDEGDINPNEDANMGIGSGGKRYVAYNRYRNTGDTAGGDAFSGDNGNKLFDVNNITPITEGRNTYYEIDFNENIYNEPSAGIVKDFDEQEAKDFTEPFYIVNIIQTGKTVQDLNINNYKSTGHYQKVRSIIGQGNNEDNQTFELIDERWEDCCPSLLSTDFNANGESFVYLVDSNGNERIYLNVTHLSGPTIAGIESDITNNGFYLATNGFEVVGIYTHTIDSEGAVSLVFNYPSYNPQAGETVIVKYDDTRPIVFYGGDTVVNENIFAPIDREADFSISDIDNQFQFMIPFPYRRYDVNENVFIVEDASNVTNSIQASDRCRIGYLRQLCVMYAAESITATNFAFNSDSILAYFPLVHYIMRPGKWDDGSFGGDPADVANDNDIYDEYFIDFPDEYLYWKFGGFRFLPQINTDYSVKGPTLYFSKPDVGFDEQNEFCTGVTWSLSRAINQQDSPGLKTFLASNKYFTDDDNGGIVKTWDARTDGKGTNLYAITKGGICLLLTKKSILSNLDGNDLTTTSVGDFIGGEYWISTNIGSNDEMWRGMAEGSIEITTEGGKVEVPALFIPNSHSVYRLMENQVIDILKDKYRTRAKQSLQSIQSGYATKITGHYNKNNNEYWLQMPDVENLSRNKCFVYAQDTNHWVGRFTYNFDSYVSSGGKNYGFKNLAMYELDKGYRINNLPIIAYLIQHCSTEINEEKEFISFEVNTGPRGTMKPTEIVFMDEEQNELCRLNSALFGNLYLKQYNGWWNQIPRKEVSVSPNRERVQYRLLLFKIIHSFEEDFKIVSTTIQYKNLK
jgi:hypothetical protein